MWSPIADDPSSEPMGRERIPRPRSISRTTESINSIESTKTTVEDLLPWCRFPRAFAIFAFCELKLNWVTTLINDEQLINWTSVDPLGFEICL